jgi:diguanylate cyclase (GGDEF)-like protein
VKLTVAGSVSGYLKQLSDDGDDPGHNQSYYTGFPIFVVAFALFWAGALGAAQHVWTRGREMNYILSFDCSLMFLLCGMALVFARSNVYLARMQAFASFVVTVFCIVNEMTAVTLFNVRPFDMPVHLETARAIIMCLLTLCIAGCTFGDTLRQLARWVAAATILFLIVTHFAPDGFAMKPAASDTAAFVTLLLVLTAAAVISLSIRSKPAMAFANRTVAITGMLGALLSVLAWFALTAFDRDSVRDHALKSSVHVVETLSRTVHEHLDLMKRMALRWESLGAMPPPMLLQQELRSYLQDIKAIDLIAITDPSHQIQSYEAQDTSNHQWLAHHKTDADYLALIGQAHQAASPHVGAVDGRTIIAAPLSEAPLKGWTIVAVYDAAALVAQSLAPSPGQIKMRISQDRQLIYDGVISPAPIAFISRITMPLFSDYAWQVSAWYEYRAIPTIEALFPDLVLWVCLIFTYLLTRSQKVASVLFVRSGQLQYALLHDSLTGLPNAKYLATALKEACKTAMKKKVSVWVVLIDPAGIKLINASMGQTAGDDVVREAAQRISRETGDQGIVARMKGDDFVVVVTDCSADDIQKLTIRIIDAIGKPYYFAGGQRSLTANAGLTVSDGSVADPMELVRQAHLAMTRAKLEGRNAWCEYSADLDEAIFERLALRNRLQAAVHADALELEYQPSIDGQTGRIVAAEALLRWNDPERGYISPATFVPVAEEMGMIVPLTEWVLTRACRDIKALRARNVLDFPIQINISPLHFERDDFIESIRSKLAEQSLPSDVLAIEITEGVLMDNASDTINKFQELKNLNIKVSIDDFGTGYSSLSYLKNLPIDKIKIDKSFVSDVVTNQQDATLVKAIIGLAHNLNVRVVAEGVETESQYWFLRRNFCDEFQGYLFARPMPRDELERRLMEGGSRHPLPQAQSAGDSARTLLLLDDEENILRALQRLLRRDGYNILIAKTPREAFTLLAENDVHVIVSDQRMPEMSGTEFFSSVKQMYPNTVRLVLSGYTDLKSVTDAINHGAIYKFLTKPWDDEELRAEIAQAFRVGGVGEGYAG